MPITGSTDYTDDLRLAHVLADDADSLTQARFKALDLHVMSKPDLTPVTDADKAVELGIVGISKGPDDPQGAARVTRAGWITFGVTTALVVIGWVIFFALLAAGTFDGSASYDYQEL